MRYTIQKAPLCLLARFRIEERTGDTSRALESETLPVKGDPTQGAVRIEELPFSRNGKRGLGGEGPSHSVGRGAQTERKGSGFGENRCDGGADQTAQRRL